MIEITGAGVTARALHQAALTGAVSCVEIAQAHLARIAARQPQLNAFAEVCTAAALAQAAALDAERARGVAPGPLFGLPLSVKDIINTAGIATRWGSQLMRDNIPQEDAVAVARLKAAGAILIGKTTSTEFAHSMMGRSPLTGLTVNPWNAAFTCGGSSCGAGVAVATGQGTLALSTDAGASTRLPAALAGVAGLKPTLGVIPHNQVPDGFGNFIHLGLMARDIDGLARMLDVVSGAHDADPHSLARPATRVLAAIGAGGSLAGKRIGLLRMAGNQRLAGDALAALERAVATFQQQGAQVKEITYPLENPEITWRALQQMNWAARFAARLEEIRPRIDASYARGIAEGAALSGLELQGAIQKRTDIFRAVQAWFRDCDFVLSPVASRGALAADHGVLDPIEIDGETVGDMRREWTPYLSLFDLSGHPAISLPAGVDANRVPIGVQLVARWHADAALLHAASLYESAAPWAERMPLSA